MNANSHRRALPFFLMTIALLVAACDGGTGGDGTGNAGSNCQAVGCDGGAGGTTTTTTAGYGGTGTGGGDVCHPTLENGWCANEACECLPTDTSEESWCANWPNICPPGVSTCGLGHNHCGYDLPLGEDYVAPDPTCIGYVDGHTWSGQNGPDTVQPPLEPYDKNGQYHVGFGSLLGGEAGYYNGFIMSGLKFYWNRSIAAGFESGEGEITPDCESITVRFYYEGETTPYKTRTVGFVQ